MIHPFPDSTKVVWGLEFWLPSLFSPLLEIYAVSHCGGPVQCPPISIYTGSGLYSFSRTYPALDTYATLLEETKEQREE